MGSPNTREVTPQEINILRQNDSFKMLQRILTKVLKVDGVDGEFELKKLEAFSSLEGNGKKHQKGFDEKERVQGEVFVAWFMSSPILTIVVDPQDRSLVRINSVEQDGKEISIKELLEMAGYKREDYKDAKSYKEAVGEFIDGQQTLSSTYESPIRLEDPENGNPVLSLRKETKAKVADNSLGIFIKD